MLNHIPKTPPKPMLITVPILLVLLVLTACGTKGPLYIPEQRYPDGVPKQQNVPPETNNKDTDKKELNRGVENDATKKYAPAANIHAASRAS